MSSQLLCLLLVLNLAHWVFDFVWQTDEMAVNNSKSLKWLGIHCFVYSIPFWFLDLKFGAIAFVSHIIIDGVTSRINSYLWAKERRHEFFTSIGFDQFLHTSVILLTVYYLGK